MMHGYSVQDAASVLGVPEGRVWELLARGVLNGTPEGDSMRVFLKADAPAESRPAPHEELPRGNGNGGSHEASAFRELLTEFRNLTERYGQALLALGEARGEVAGLRSRVELLEARIDLRLPARLDAEPIAWEAPTPRAPAPEAPAPEGLAPEPPAPAEVEAVLPTPAPVERTSRSRKARSTRAAVAGFAEALARAQDPNPAEVGEVLAPELEADAEASTAEAEAEHEEPTIETAPEPTLVEMVEPPFTPEPPVEPETEAAPEPALEATYRAVEIEPDWFADGDFSWLDAADLEARGQADATAREISPVVAAELESEAAAAPAPAVIAHAEALPPEVIEEAAPELTAIGIEEADPTLTPQPFDAAELSSEPEAAVVAEAVPVDVDGEAAPEVVAEAVPPVVEKAAAEAALPEVESPEEPPRVVPVAAAPVTAAPVAAAPVDPAPVVAAPVVAAPVAVPQMEPVEMSGAGEEAVMWLGGSPEPADEMEVAGGGLYPGPTLAPRIRDALEQVAWPTADHRVATVQAPAPAPAQPVPPPLAMTEAELAQLARDEGWDDAEVAAIRAMISRPAPATVELPGSAELDEAISALQAVPIAPRSAPAPGSQWAKPATRDEEPRIRDDWAFEVEPHSGAAAQPPLEPRRVAPDPDWVRRRRGPAATAYRRIRRIFTG